ncbi:MAG: DNA alkylation repair protein [Paludibacteraceae bacterium]
MRFFIENKKIDEAVREIRRKISASKNGVVADSMKQYGVIYKNNFGVDIPRLKEIASQYTSDHDLSQRLWALRIRESMILAMWIQPVEKMTPTIANNWLDDIQQLELAEQAVMNLFSKLDFATELAQEWIYSTDKWHQTTGLLLISRIWNNISNEQAEQIIHQLIQLSDTESVEIYASVAVTLCRLARRGREVREEILRLISPFEHSNSFGQKYIFVEVNDELSFSNFS